MRCRSFWCVWNMIGILLCSQALMLFINSHVSIYTCENLHPSFSACRHTLREFRPMMTASLWRCWGFSKNRSEMMISKWDRNGWDQRKVATTKKWRCCHLSEHPMIPCRVLAISQCQDPKGQFCFSQFAYWGDSVSKHGCFESSCDDFSLA